MMWLILERLLRLRECTRGNVIILVGLAAFMMLAAVGTAVDMSRAQILQTRISSALDAAGLAAGATASTPPNGFTPQHWVQDQATKYFNANFPLGYLDSGAITPVATLSRDQNTVTLNASGTQSTSFMTAFGINSVSVAAHSEVTRTNNGTGMEIALVVDNSTSMGHNLASQPTTKLQALQTAATELVNILYGTNETVPNLWVSVIPFTQAVNVGNASQANWFDPADSGPGQFAAIATDPPTSWGGCVLARSSPYDVSDDVPSLGNPATLFDKSFYYTSSDTFGYNRWAVADPTSPSPPRYKALPPYNTPFSYTLGPNFVCPQQVTTMTAHKTAILNAINNLVAAGDTHLDLGLAWGWRMLSPSWRGVWNSLEMSTNGLPLDYSTPNMQKVIIFITDGTNEMNTQTYTAYGFLSDGTLGASQDEANGTLDSRTAALCSTLKSKGIVIYTIGFGNPAPDDPPTETDRQDGTLVDAPLLSNCASPGDYKLAPDNATLRNVFRQIGNSLVNLRISK